MFGDVSLNGAIKGLGFGFDLWGFTLAIGESTHCSCYGLGFKVFGCKGYSKSTRTRSIPLCFRVWVP